MTKSVDNSKQYLKITASLLNSWSYQFHCEEQYAEKAREDFIKTLKRIKEPPNKYMLRGIEFEEKCYNGEFPQISEKVEGGAFQVYHEKEIVVDGKDIIVLGYADALKEGIVYDIKRVSRYDLQKYFHSYQHHVYLFLLDNTYKFEYLVAQGPSDKNLNYYVESYTRDEIIDVKDIVAQFFDYLKSNNLYEIYEQNWKIKKGEVLL